MYQPEKEILEKYARVMVRYALGKGKGIKKGDTVRVIAGESAKPLFVEVIKEIYRAGGNVISSYLPDDDEKYNLSKDFYDIANKKQINFFPEKYFKGLVDSIDHSIFILSETNKKSLEGVPPKKIMQRGIAQKAFREMLEEKENRKKFSWTLCMYGTEEMARESKQSLKSYWNEIIKACYLDVDDPVKKWQEIQKNTAQTIKKLNKLKIESVHIKGDDTDLHLKIGEKRKWLGGSGANIPSFEIFISPDWRGTNGKIRFTEPLYRYGNLIDGIELEFKDGKVINSKAKIGEKVLKEMIATKDADKVGEFSLTDGRVSRITKFMAETLFDENVGGKYGNTHIALGNAYKDSLDGDPSKLKKTDWDKLGFNSSVVHTDIVSTANRVVTAKLKNGKEIILYKDGSFVI